LGSEFLTWLYFYIDQVQGEMLVSQLIPKWPTAHQTIRIRTGKRISLKTLASGDTKISIACPALEDRGEVLQAIREGTYIDSLSLDLVLGERIHSLTIQAVDGAISQVKTSEVFHKLNNEDFDEEEKEIQHEVELETNILLKMANLDEIEDLLDGLFEIFLKRRLASAFIEKDICVIRQMVSEGLLAKLPKTMKQHEKNQAASP